jgi:hypothetical protein
VRRVMACGVVVALVVGLLAGCGSDGGEDSIGTGSEATLHGYCSALLRMNRELGSLAVVRDNLEDKAKTRESVAYLHEVRDHAPGELAEVWQDVIDGYKALAAVEGTDRNEMIRKAVKSAERKLPADVSKAQKATATFRAAVNAVKKEEKADKPYQRTADQLLRDAVPNALGSARGACDLTWSRG